MVEKGEYICTLVNLEDTQYQLITYNNQFAVVEFAIVREVKLGNGITKYTHIAEKKWENVKSVKYLRDWELRPMYKALSKYVEEVPNTNITCVESLKNNIITVNNQ